MENYADVMEDGIKALEEQGVLARLADLGIDTQYFNQSVFEFRIAAQEFDFVSKENLTETQTRVINDQMRGFERTFLLYDGRYTGHRTEMFPSYSSYRVQACLTVSSTVTWSRPPPCLTPTVGLPSLGSETFSTSWIK